VAQRLRLLWKDRHVADVEGAAWDDFPWVSGKFISVDLPPELRQALEWLSSMAEADELEDPPFDEELVDHWVLSSPVGHKAEVCAPIVDFEAGTVEWR
jgi:hypothetical protein